MNTVCVLAKASPIVYAPSIFFCVPSFRRYQKCVVWTHSFRFVLVEHYNKMATQSCQVRVGVRVRPLTSKETSEGGKSVVECNPFNHTIELGSKRKFTYDSVFHSNVDQIDLYNDVSPPLLNAFLGGYNATGESKIYSCIYCLILFILNLFITSCSDCVWPDRKW